MIACGRRCCLCHKFTGVGIECHHITPQSKGGDDTYDNCIPLCFDCHAEVGHYSAEHPRGTKFSPEELRGHRDHWYATYTNGAGPGAPTGYEELDKKLYLKLYDLFGGSSQMIHFRDHDYSYGYHTSVDDRLWNFIHEVGLPQTEFFDAQMAAALADLRASINNYLRDKVNRIWHDGDIAHIPPEWIDKSESLEKRFEEAAEVMNKAATRICETFTQFVKTARFCLKVEHE
jgi:hypothetical protein